MALLNILQAPDPRLKVKSEPVAVVDDELRRLLDDMLETMYMAPGIGLATPQVGVPRHAAVIDLGAEPETRRPLFLVNPEVTWRSDELAAAEESCLSLPEQFAEVSRPAEVEVTYLGRDGERHTLRADGLLARCLQHEIDHLDGVLFVDHISALKRGMILRRLAKAKRGKTRASA
jgi:peptide deformylase